VLQPRKSHAIPPLDLGIGAALALFAFFLLSFVTSSSPQSADGCELIRTSLNGGVLHPPGFSVQAATYRLLSRIFHFESTRAFSVIGQAAMSLSIFFIYQDVRSTALKVGTSLGPKDPSGGILSGQLQWHHPFVRLLSAIAALSALSFPSVIGVVSQPELFSLSFLWISLAPFLPAWLWLGLAWHVHPITLVALFRLKWASRIETRLKVLALALLMACLGGLALFAFRSEASWPDWGKLRTIHQLLNHLLRAEFGVFQLAIAPTSLDLPVLSGLSVALQEILQGFPLLLLLFPVAILVVWHGSPLRSPYRSQFLTLVLAALLLTAMRLPGDDPYHRAILERFLGIFCIPLSVFVFGALGATLLPINQASRLRFLQCPPVAVAITILSVTSLLYSLQTGLHLGNHSIDHTLSVFRSQIQRELQAIPPSSLYIAGQSEEYFCGIPAAQSQLLTHEAQIRFSASLGEIRYPVLQGLFLARPWYVLEVLGSHHPKLQALADQMKRTQFRALTVGDLLEALFGTQRSLSEIAKGPSTQKLHLSEAPLLASIDSAVFQRLGLPFEERGPLLVSPPLRSNTQLRRLNSICRDASDLLTLPDLPKTHFGYSVQLRKFMARGTLAARNELRAAPPNPSTLEVPVLHALEELTLFLYQGQPLSDRTKLASDLNQFCQRPILKNSHSPE
jgi:hypothetical protein